MLKRRRILKVVGVLLLVVVIAASAVFFAFMHAFYPSPPALPATAAATLADAQKQDLDYLANYFAYNRTYTPDRLQQAKALREQALAKAGTLTPAQFDLSVARIVALADNGHSRVHPGPLSRLNNHIACHLYHFDDGYYVLRARGACEPLLGLKIEAIDDQPIDALADHMFEYFGGPRNHYDQFASVFFLESPALLNAAGAISDANRVKLRARAHDGSARDLELTAEPPDANAPRVYSDEYLSPERVESESADWKSFLQADAKLPTFLRDYHDPFRTEFYTASGVYYVQFRSNADEPGHPIGPFVERVRREIVSDSPQYIVLDLRLDQGGNFTTTANLMSSLLDLTNTVDHIYVLTGAWTFSAGDVSLALVMEHSRNRVTVIGSTPGDRLRLWAEGGNMVLPNSKLSIGYATGLHDYSQPCTGQPGCFWTMYFYPTHVASFEPDVNVSYTFDDYANLRDPVMEQTLKLISARISH